MPSIRIRPTYRSVQTERSRREGTDAIHASTSQLRREYSANFLRNIRHRIRSRFLQFSRFARVMVLITRFRHHATQVRLIRSLRRLIRRLFLPFRDDTRVITCSVKGEDLLSHSTCTNRVRGTFVANHVFKALHSERPENRLCHRRQYIRRLILNVSQVCIRPFRGSFNSNDVRILMFRLTSLSTISHVNPFTARLFSVRMINSNSSLFIKHGPCTGLTVFSLQVVLRMFRNNSSDDRSSLVVHSWRNFTINRSSVLSFVVIRFKGRGQQGRRIFFNTRRSVPPFMACSAQLSVLTQRVKTNVRVNSGTSYQGFLHHVNERNDRRMTLIVRNSIFRSCLFRLFRRHFNGRTLSQHAKDRAHNFTQLNIRHRMLRGSVYCDRGLVVGVADRGDGWDIAGGGGVVHVSTRSFPCFVQSCLFEGGYFHQGGTCGLYVSMNQLPQ